MLCGQAIAKMTFLFVRALKNLDNTAEDDKYSY